MKKQHGKSRTTKLLKRERAIFSFYFSFVKTFYSCYMRMHSSSADQESVICHVHYYMNNQLVFSQSETCNFFLYTGTSICVESSHASNYLLRCRFRCANEDFFAIWQTMHSIVLIKFKNSGKDIL